MAYTRPSMEGKLRSMFGRILSQQARPGVGNVSGGEGGAPRRKRVVRRRAGVLVPEGGAPRRKRVVRRRMAGDGGDGGASSYYSMGKPKRYSVGAGPAGKRAASKNPWIKFVKKYAAAKGMTYGEALKAAGPSYRRQMR